MLEAIGTNEYSSYKAQIPVVSPQIIESYWTDDKGNKIEKSNLENIVYFHIKTKGIPNGSMIELQLFDEDTFFDDKTFGGGEIKPKMKIQNNEGKVELELPKEWTDDLTSEEWNLVLFTWKSHYRKLYWKATYKTMIKDEKISTFLDIHYSDKTLYVKSSEIDECFPEMYSTEGELIMVVLTQIEDKLKELAIDSVKAQIEKGISRYALSKIEKGYMVDNTGKLYGGTTSDRTKRMSKKETVISTNDGVLIKTRKGRDFTYTYGGKTHSTVGISQYDHFASEHFASKFRIRGLLQYMGDIWNVFDLTQFALNPDRSAPLPSFFPLPPAISIGVNVLGIIATAHFKEINDLLEQDRRYSLEKAKKEGLEAVKSLVNRWKDWNGVGKARGQELDGDDIEYGLIGISNETASKIIQGEFRTIEDLRDSNEGDSEDLNVTILYRDQVDSVRGERIRIIETFFIE